MTPRLYIEAPLRAGAAAPLSPGQVHYLKNVLRRAPGDQVLAFNARDGEFAAEITELKKQGGLAEMKRRSRAPHALCELRLLFAPVKRAALELIVQKATELGVTGLTPVITERTATPKINLERLGAIAIEAAEQSERLSVPSIDAPAPLDQVLDAWPQGRRLIFCDEAGDDAQQPWGGAQGRAAPMLDILAREDGGDQWDLLIGPEGGFSPAERTLIRAHAFVAPVTLGPRILKADTAAIAALALLQAAKGDWRTP